MLDQKQPGWAGTHSQCPTHHIQVLGNPPFPQLLHPLAHVGETRIVIICILLRQVIDVSQGAVLRVRRAGGRNGKRTKAISPPANAPHHLVFLCAALILITAGIFSVVDVCQAKFYMRHHLMLRTALGHRTYCPQCVQMDKHLHTQKS